MSSYHNEETFREVSDDSSFASATSDPITDEPTDDWLSESDARSYVEAYSGYRAGKQGLRQAANLGDLGEVRVVGRAHYYSQSKLTAWMDLWEWFPPAGLHLNRSGPIPPTDPIPEFWRRVAPKYFCRVRNGKPDAKEAHEDLSWGKEPARD
jgi:hypothetical protein